MSPVVSLQTEVVTIIHLMIRDLIRSNDSDSLLKMFLLYFLFIFMVLGKYSNLTLNNFLRDGEKSPDTLPRCR